MHKLLRDIPETLLWVGAVILGVFVAMEKSGERASWLDNWKASDLKPIDGHQQISKAETFFDLGLSTLALLWLTDIIRFPAMIRHDGIWITGWTVLLPTWFWLAAGALLVFDVGFCLVRLMRGFWSKKLRLTTIVTNLLWISLLLYGIAQPQLLSIQEQVSTDILELLPMANRALDGVLAVICLILTWEMLTHIWRLVRK